MQPSSPSITVPESARILVVDDRDPVREVLREQLSEIGYAVLEASDGVEALDLLKRTEVDLVVSDLRMPRMDGLTLLKRLGDGGPPTMLFSAYGDVPTAVDAMRAGALDFITLPIDPEELAAQVARHLAQTQRATRGGGIVGEHPATAELRERISRVAQRDVSVLITGESGVGKEVVAREIHFRSRRCDGPFVAVNCCALPESLLESELFGHERGSFTGATARKVGRFERADRGTLFLDEIGDAPAPTQAKLLRVLQEQEFERVGGLQTISVDVRIVAATNRDLREMRDRGEFRDDLFHRLNVFPIRVPPLRERPGDIRALVDNISNSKDISLRWTEAAMERLCAHRWPGNVRELENALQRLMILCDQDPTVTLERVEQALDADPAEAAPSRALFEEEERDRYERLLREQRWNISAAARELGVSRGALRHRLRKYGLL